MERLAPIAVGLLLFASGWGQTLAAAFCPHARGGHACCLANRNSHDHDQASQHEAAPPSSNTITGGATASLDQSAEECGHCMSHPRLPAVPAAGAAGQSNSVEGLAAPPPAMVADASTPIFTTAIISRQHAPPSFSSPRHVLINVFRI
jgi:hypothetical protein